MGIRPVAGAVNLEKGSRDETRLGWLLALHEIPAPKLTGMGKGYYPRGYAYARCYGARHRDHQRDVLWGQPLVADALM